MQTNTAELKTRATRLRHGILKTLGVDASIAQTLEILAMQDNTPNLDVTSAYYGNSSAKKPARSYLSADQVELRNNFFVVSGKTGTGRTVFSLALANRLADPAQCHWKTNVPKDVSIVVISPCREWTVLSVETVIEALDSSFKEKIERLDLRRTILMIDGCIDELGNESYWLDLAKRAYGSVVTIHTSFLDKLASDDKLFFQHFDCNPESAMLSQ